MVAVHSLSKRSNLAGLRVGFYAGDPELVDYLSEVRKHVGFMVPGPVQAGRCRRPRRRRPRRRASGSATGTGWPRMQQILGRLGVDGRSARRRLLPVGAGARTATPGRSPTRLAAEGGVLVSPGDFYGAAGAGRVRIAMVQPDDRLELVAARLGG